MAVASPVLERNVETEEKEFTREYRNPFMTAEERHNSLISSNYAKLINPESKLVDIIDKKPVHRVEEQNIAPAQNIQPEKPYLVENARADADIFRADNPINRKLFGFAETDVANTEVEAKAEIKIEDEENEDLRPTMTTIQYKTEGVKKTVDEGKIEVKPVVTKKSILTKKDKIIIAVALSVIVALFVLIIVNSVVISNLSGEVNVLQSTLTTVENTYEEALAAKDAYLDPANLDQVISEFANGNGMVLR